MDTPNDLFSGLFMDGAGAFAESQAFPRYRGCAIDRGVAYLQARARRRSHRSHRVMVTRGSNQDLGIFPDASRGYPDAACHEQFSQISDEFLLLMPQFP